MEEFKHRIQYEFNILRTNLPSINTQQHRLTGSRSTAWQMKLKNPGLSVIPDSS